MSQDYDSSASWQWCAAWQPMTFEPCDVMISNLPVAIANDDDCIEAMLQQAGLVQSLIAFERQGKKSGKVLVSLESRNAAEYCIAHFQSCQWIRHKNGESVKAHIIGDEPAEDAEPKDDVVTKYLPVKLEGQRVLHQVSPGTFRVEIPRSFSHLLGIAYRKSMRLNDRDSCGIDHGQIVSGKQANGWVAVEFKKTDGVDLGDAPAPAAALSPCSADLKRSTSVESGASTLSRQCSAEAEHSESELSSTPKSDGHGADTACPSDDDSDRSSQVHATGKLGSPAQHSKHSRLAWADVETDDEDDFGA
jgi:hypothetical protein